MIKPVLDLGKHGQGSVETLLEKIKKLKHIHLKGRLFEHGNDFEYSKRASCFMLGSIEYISHAQLTNRALCSKLGAVKYVSCLQSANQASHSIPKIVEYIPQTKPHTHRLV